MFFLNPPFNLFSPLPVIWPYFGPVPYRSDRKKRIDKYIDIYR